MYTENCKFNFSRLSDSDFLSKAECIIQCMAGIDFPPHIPKTGDMKIVFDQYKSAYEKVSKSSIFNPEEKNKARLMLEKMLVKLPAYCEIATIDEMVKVCGIVPAGASTKVA